MSHAIEAHVNKRVPHWEYNNEIEMAVLQYKWAVMENKELAWPRSMNEKISYVRYSPEVTSHSLKTFSSLPARVPLELAIYQVKSVSF